MYKIDSVNNITVTRGDTLKIKFSIKDSTGATYTPSASDVIKFKVKKYPTESTYIFNKTVDNDTLTLTISSSDMKIDVGVYKYDLEITFNDGVVNTPINMAKFEVVAEV